MTCSCDGSCGRHLLVLTIHAEGWMAGCHCRAGHKMPPGLYGEKAEIKAAELHQRHLEIVAGGAS